MSAVLGAGAVVVEVVVASVLESSVVDFGAAEKKETYHQWLRQISMKLPFAVWRKTALKFTKGSKRENSISYYFLLFWFNQNSISVLKTLLSCLSEKTL